ncbi:hypothetical protein NEMIN01_2418 [Nematocida minor]|uniref:uncharacterized protein n=1 Tax=Nematocida minor TaxID=1912983 RepID=UPI00221FB16C|nr:uncharacterized protein NEMIN01_2418 [Nematocida minor]KAI5193218.1 hypothetical protein NEMIN01_2418 [Nematocida minor]
MDMKSSTNDKNLDPRETEDCSQKCEENSKDVEIVYKSESIFISVSELDMSSASKKEKKEGEVENLFKTSAPIGSEGIAHPEAKSFSPVFSSPIPDANKVFGQSKTDLADTNPDTSAQFKELFETCSGNSFTASADGGSVSASKNTSDSILKDAPSSSAENKAKAVDNVIDSEKPQEEELNKNPYEFSVDYFRYDLHQREVQFQGTLNNLRNSVSRYQKAVNRCNALEQIAQHVINRSLDGVQALQGREHQLGIKADKRVKAESDKVLKLQDEIEQLRKKEEMDKKKLEDCNLCYSRALDQNKLLESTMELMQDQLDILTISHQKLQLRSKENEQTISDLSNYSISLKHKLECSEIRSNMVEEVINHLKRILSVGKDTFNTTETSSPSFTTTVSSSAMHRRDALAKEEENLADAFRIFKKA